MDVTIADSHFSSSRADPLVLRFDTIGFYHPGHSGGFTASCPARVSRGIAHWASAQHKNLTTRLLLESSDRARSKGMNAVSNWPGNRLLLALPSRHLKRLMPELEQVRCQRGQVLLDADSSLDHVFFPDSGVVSVVAVYADGSVIEMATIGREGCTGVQAVFGAKSSSVQLLVQIPGSAAKMSRAAFVRAMESMPSFRILMYTYVHAFLEQVLVSVACNGAHSLKQRLARWLLMMRDRSDDEALPITHSLLAEMLGVQRPTITNSARELERAGLIARGRRQVTVLDRQGLIRASCECYQLVRARVAFHLPKTYP
jgi:CRP-like cAMP-binding protein